MTDHIYCSKCYYNRVRFVGDVCADCESKAQKPDDDERNRQMLNDLERKPRTWRDVFGIGKRKK